MSSSKLSRDSKKFRFSQVINNTFFEGINLKNKASFIISQGTDVLAFRITKKELDELIENLSILWTGLKNS